MSKFRIAVEFTGITVDEAREAVKDVLPNDDKGCRNDEITANGFWHVLKNNQTDKAIVDGKLVWDCDADGAKLVPEHSGILLTPLITKHGVWDVTPVMNKLYSAGAVVMSVDCVTIHYQGNFSSAAENAIIKRLAHSNRLLCTVLFFPRLLAPLWTPTRSDEQNDALAAAIYHSYKEITDGVYWHRDGAKLISGVVADLLKNHVGIKEVNCQYKTRFDRDSSPDSKNDE